jgi:hypothetical protein
MRMKLGFGTDRIVRRMIGHTQANFNRVSKHAVCFLALDHAMDY